MTALLAGSAAALHAQAPPAAPAGLSARRPAAVELEVDTLRVGGRDRVTHTYAPASARTGAPLVLVLHGAPGDGPLMREFLAGRLEELADRDGFVVSYPDGWERYWNDCRAAADVAANRLGVDDPAFLRAVAARLHATHGIDRARVRVLGVSNGAHMAFRLALEAPADVQAVAAVAATLPAADNLDCVPVEEPVPVLVVVGTADRISPYEGGPVTAPDGRPRGAVRSAPDTAEWFARVAGAPAEPLRETVLEPHPVTGIWAERLTWGPARGAEVVLLTVHGGGHVVHGPGLAFPPELGPIDPRLDVLEEALRFFERQPPAARRAGAPARTAQQACGLAGESFTTTLTVADAGGDPVTAGRWRIAFAAGGRFAAEQNGAAAIEGSYDVRGDHVTFRDEVGTMACEGRAGTYSWRRSGERLELRVVKDVCPGRVAVFTAHPLRRDRGAGPVSNGEP